MKHVVVFPEDEIVKLLAGQLKYVLKLFKRKPEFLKDLSAGDLIFFRKSRREILGGFLIGKLLIIERVGNNDWEVLKTYLQGLMTKEIFETKVQENSILVIIQIQKLEQFITSPIDVPKGLKKEWLILE